MKKIVREYEFSPAQLHDVAALARSLSLTETTVKILFARGIDTEEKIVSFLHPSARNFLSPFLMQGMKEAKALLTEAKEKGSRVAVFGDYDADGIGATAIMSRALTAFGIRPYLYVPERTEGYGMSIAAIDRIFAEFSPDLILTVDCGISNRKEAAYIRSRGAQVIVTDHHELPDELPDCICINPKFRDEYPYDNLCGAGVAFKVAQALIGDKANELLDFAALSTVADSVSLLGENRDIVAEGLRRIARSPRPAFAALLEKNKDEVTAQTLAFTVAPRINAAGRMGDARSALRLFTSEDKGEIYALAAQLNAYNLERQKCCDELYAQAAAQIRAKGAYGHVIMLEGEEWNTGFVGIVAARIAEEYARPALLFVRKGDMLKGSARSIDSVNIFEALKACSQYIEEFGGHAQAAGVNVRADNFASLARALDEYIGSHYTREDFIPAITVSEETEGALSMQLARELNALEPYGVGHRRPLFSMRTGAMSARLIKPLSPHVAASAGGMDFMYFGGAKQLKLLRSDLAKTLVFECNLSKFRGREYLKGFIRCVVYDGMSGSEVALDGFESAVRTLPAGAALSGAERADTASLNALIAEKRRACAYGLCAVAGDRATLDAFPALAGLDVDVFEPSSASLLNRVLVYPAADCDLSGYRDVVFLDGPLSSGVRTGDAKVYRNGELCGFSRLRKVSLSRSDLLSVFAALRQAEGRIEGETYAEAARSFRSREWSEEQIVFSLAVFEELGLLTLADGRLRIHRGKKTELSASRVYTQAMRLLGEE